MSIYKVISYIIIILCLLTIYGLFTIKDSVVTLTLELEEVKKQVRNEQDAIRILKAELAYLGSPERIQKLAHKYLILEKPKVTQITKDPLLEEKSEQSKIFASAKTLRKSNKWRYKKGPAKYLTMVKD